MSADEYLSAAAVRVHLPPPTANAFTALYLAHFDFANSVRRCLTLNLCSFPLNKLHTSPNVVSKLLDSNIRF